MPGRKDSDAQRRAKAEAEERAAWRRESILAEQDELAREAERWHPQQNKQLKSSSENKPSSPSKSQVHRDSLGNPVTALFTSAAGS